MLSANNNYYFKNLTAKFGYVRKNDYLCNIKLKTITIMIMISNLKANAMNKVMYFMANCGYDAVKELIYNSFDKNLADHIFDKYMEISEYASRPFFELYFAVDSDCKKAILNYIENNYNIPEI